MKYKKQVEKLKQRQAAWDKSGPAFQKANKRPGSQKK